MEKYGRLLSIIIEEHDVRMYLAAFACEGGR